MTKRNFKNEILNLKERGEFESGLYDTYRLLNLKKVLTSFESNTNAEIDELYKYAPIATVATIESFTRSAIKSLIDKGSPYFEKSALLFGRTIQKLDFETLLNLQNKSFTIGELVSHLLPCNNLTDVISNLTVLLGDDLFNCLKKHKIIVFGEYDNAATTKFRKNLDSIKRSIIRTFENRHIFCHEANSNLVIDRALVMNDLDNCLLFLEMASNFIFSKIYHDWGTTTHQKVEKLAKLLEEKEKNIAKKILEIRNERISTSENKREFKKHFDATIKFWKRFIEEKAHLKSSYTMSAIWVDYIYLEDKIASIEAFEDDIR